MVMLKLGYDSREKHNWKVLSKEYSKPEYNNKLVVNIHERLWEKVKRIKVYQKKGFDTIVMIDGPRRGGKSTIAKTIGYLLNPNITIDNFVPGLEEAPDKILKAKEDDPLIFDEGSLVANSKDGMTKLNKQLEKIIDVCGVKRLALIFCMPSFFKISQSIAVEHSRFLIHVYLKKMQRGKFAYFGTKKKKLLYSIGKKHFGSYKKPKANWIGTFDDFRLPFEEDYVKLKAESLAEALGVGRKDNKPKTESEYKSGFIYGFKKNSPEVTDKTIAKGFEISQSEYYRRMRLMRKLHS